MIQVRLLNEQFSYPLDTAFSQNVDQLLIFVLVALTAVHLLYVSTGRRQTAPALLIVATAVAAHFYIPGRGKLALDWLATNDLSNFAFNSYAAGWRGQGDGTLARGLGNFLTTMGWPARFGILFVELGAVVAVAHHRLLRVWLPLWAVFHAFNFALSGFFFFDWLVLEAALWIVILAPSLREWVDENSTPARALWAVMAVMAGATLFHPPTLAWLDPPVGYGYEVEATGQSGREYHVPLSAFAPFEQEMTFSRVEFSPIQRAAGAYGAISSTQRLRDLQRLASFEELSAYEAALGPVATYANSPSELLMTSFLDHVNGGTRRPWFLPSRPSRFWSGRPSPSFDYDEPLQTLRVILVASLVVDGSQRFRRTPVLQVERGADGRAVVTARASEQER